MTTQAHLIDGEWKGAAAGATFERINPYTGEVAAVAAAGGRDDARAAVDAAAAAFPAWSRTAAAEDEGLTGLFPSAEIVPAVA
jgi:acyl-CoA reductase-like NAD-dependent aldehyde dehydrogenase